MFKRAAISLAMAFGVCGLLTGTAFAQADHMGGTLRLVAPSSEGTIDPQINYTVMNWQINYIVYDGLIAFAKTSGTKSNDIVADLAESVPKPQDGGKTYVFKLRPGIEFSNGKPVTPDDVVATFERLFKVSNPNAGTWYNVIVGGDGCLKTPATCSLKDGVVADDKAGTVTFHLAYPDAEFLYQLAVPFGDILPADTPPHDLGTQAPPGTGPYMIVSYQPNHEMKLVRNPHFKQWSAEAQPNGYVNEIDYSFGLTAEAETTAVANGQADWMFASVPTDRLGEVGTRYAKQAHINPLFAFYYVAMNTRLAPFDNIDVRRAVNYGLDRKATVNFWGGPRLAQPTCQILPPNFPGHQFYCPWTTKPGKQWAGPDMAKAKELMQKAGAVGKDVTLIVQDRDPEREIGTYLQSYLNQVGFHASLKPISANIEFTYIQNTKNNVQISLTDWYEDYPAPSDFLNVLFSCANFHPGSDASPNISGFCDHKIDAQMNQALTTQITDPESAYQMWAKIDQQVTDAAPVAPLFNPKKLDFVSQRLGNFTFSYQIQLIFSKVWVQ
jgi:peptide/nickel transport system substrate-binding protein